MKNKGKIWTDEEKQKISKALKGIKLKESQMRSLRGRVGDKNGGQNPFASKFKVTFPNGDTIIFETRKEMEIFFKDKYGMSSKPLTNAYTNNEPFNPRWKKYQHLKGLTIIKLNQKH